MLQTEYTRITTREVAALAEIVGKINVVTDESRRDYSHDETPNVQPVLPEVVVKPANALAVSHILKYAAEKHIAVTPRGAGSGLSGGAVPIYRGIVLSLEKMDKILEIDEANFTATVEAGVTLEKFTQAVTEHGLYYPVYPGEKTATLGGNVATNAGGMRAVKYGVTRHFVLGLEAVLPTGEIIRTGGKYIKSSTGYDLTQLICGSEGTLAVITAATLRLGNPAGSMEVLFVPYHNLADAIGTVPDILRRGIFPIGIEFIPQNVIEMVEKFTGKEVPMRGYDSYLMIILEAVGDEDIQRQAEQIGEICLNHNAVDIYLAGNENARRNLLEAREKFYPSIQHFGFLTMADVVVPRSCIADFVQQAEAITRRGGLGFIAVGHAGDGNVHLQVTGEPTDANRRTAAEILKETVKLGISLGGTISGEHGLGVEKKGYLPLAADSGKIELMKRIKRAFDPAGILNPGKILDME